MLCTDVSQLPWHSMTRAATVPECLQECQQWREYFGRCLFLLGSTLRQGSKVHYRQKLRRALGTQQKTLVLTSTTQDELAREIKAVSFSCLAVSNFHSVSMPMIGS